MSLNVLYKTTKPDISYNKIRKEYDGGNVWLDPEILALKEPGYEEKHLDVSAYFEQALAAGGGKEKAPPSSKVAEEEVDSDYQEAED